VTEVLVKVLRAAAFRSALDVDAELDVPEPSRWTDDGFVIRPSGTSPYVLHLVAGAATSSSSTGRPS
jgi:hypothetical protein